MQSIIGSTYNTFLEHSINTDSNVIPPRKEYDPAAVIPDIHSIYTLKDHFFSRDLETINFQRKTCNLETISTESIIPPSLPAISNGIIQSQTPPSNFTPEYDGVVLGGTFDRLHAGHKMMLTVASLICRKHMEIGVTDESLLGNKKYKEFIEPHELRSKNVLQFMRTLNPDLNVVMLRLLEPYANTTTSTILDALVVSPETEKVGDYINTVRKAANLKPLDIVPIQYIPPPSNSSSNPQLSSTLLRQLAYQKQHGTA